jgi:predicted urease superfamily metal-dependent hydrolase
MNMHRCKKVNEVVGLPKMKDFDLIVSSYGKHPFELKRLGGKGQSTEFQVKDKATPLLETLHEVADKPVADGVGADQYRRWMNL